MRLRISPARARPTQRIPRYPVLGLAVVGALGCSHASDPLTVVALPTPVPAAPADPPAVEPVHARSRAPKANALGNVFPEDNRPLSEFFVGCGGGCPPAYVLQTERKDETQITARIRHCVREVGATAEVHVAAKIASSGQPKEVVVTDNDALPFVTHRCIEELVKNAKFTERPKGAERYDRNGVREVQVSESFDHGEVTRRE